MAQRELTARELFVYAAEEEEDYRSRAGWATLGDLAQEQEMSKPSQRELDLKGRSQANRQHRFTLG